MHTTDPASLKERIKREAEAWHGIYVDTLSLSVGYAASCDHPGAPVADLEKAADVFMYNEKENYYKNKGIDRRRR